MNVLCILTIYNEIDFLPYKVEWCRRNGLDLYVIDNYSSDSSYAWLKSHNIPCHQIDTKEAFDLRVLQEEIIKTTDSIRPDWVVYSGADLFIFAEKPIKQLCINAEKIGKNMIGFPLSDMCHTGEERGMDVFNTFFYHKKPSRKMNIFNFIYKWEKGVTYIGDSIRMKSVKKVCYPSGIMINYGRTKSPDKRKELLKRRRLAWERGLCKGWGTHYLEEENRKFRQWDKEELEDIRKSEYWQYYESPVLS